MSDFRYAVFARIIGRIFWRGQVLGAENLPQTGPGVFVANHLGPNGPLGVICSIGLRFYPWARAEIVDPELAPEYMRLDYIEPVLKLRPPLSVLASRAIARISVPLLQGLDCIPIHKGNYDAVQAALQDSLFLLESGNIILVFPEDADRALDPRTKMRPFSTGFTRMGAMYYAAAGEILQFYPAAIHDSRRVMVGEPVVYEPGNQDGRERHRLASVLESKITEMYLTMARGDFYAGPG